MKRNQSNDRLGFGQIWQTDYPTTIVSTKLQCWMVYVTKRGNLLAITRFLIMPEKMRIYKYVWKFTKRTPSMQLEMHRCIFLFQLIFSSLWHWQTLVASPVRQPRVCILYISLSRSNYYGEICWYILGYELIGET